MCLSTGKFKCTQVAIDTHSKVRPETLLIRFIQIVTFNNSLKTYKEKVYCHFGGNEFMDIMYKNTSFETTNS